MLHRQSAGKICPSSRCQKCDIYTLLFKPLRTSVVKPVESPLTQADLSCSVLLFSSQKGIRISVLPISSKACSLVLGNHWPFQMPRCNRLDIINKRKEEREIDEWYKQKDLKTPLKKELQEFLASSTKNISSHLSSSIPVSKDKVAGQHPL